MVLGILHTILLLGTINARSLKKDFYITEIIYMRFVQSYDCQYMYDSIGSFKNIQI